MRYPEFLPENGTIGFAAPAFGCNVEPYRSAFDHAQEVFKSKGYGIDLGPNCYAGCGIGISNTPEKCGQELMDQYLSEENDVLLSCGGGELMCEVLQYVDFERLAQAKPKWYMGYSDNTNFTFLLTTLCDTASVYGPCAPAFGMRDWHPAIQDAFGVLTGEAAAGGRNARGGSAGEAAAGSRNARGGLAGEQAVAAAAGNPYPVFTFRGYDLYEVEGLKDKEHPLEPYHVTEPAIRRCFLPDGAGGLREVPAADCDVTVSGRLLGGCLDILEMFPGTPYDQVWDFDERYREDGILWFLESCDLTVLSIRRAIWQLKNAGWFDHVKGFLIGRPYNGGEVLGLDRYHAVTDLLAEYGVPVLMDLDFGHIPPMLPLITGSLATVDLKKNDLTVKMELL